MKILFLTMYSALGASTRYRTLQYFPYLRASGWSLSWHHYLSDSYLKHLYDGGRRSPLEAGRAILRRVCYLCRADLKQFDIIHVQSEALRRIPACLESFLLRNPERLVLDYDDAPFKPYQSNPRPRRKIARIAGSAAHVVVANEYLRTYFSRFTSKISVVPTVIDLAKYSIKQIYDIQPARRIVIGWIGSPASIGHLASLSETLRAVSDRHPILLRCVGAPPDFSISGVAVEHLPWIEATETSIIRTFDLGVMPLRDDPYAWGKSGLKLIQYMGCAVPAIGSAIGANCQIIQDGVNGFLASCGEDFVHKMQRLISETNLRMRLGQAGRKTVESRYSLQATAPRFCEFLTEIATARSERRIPLSSFAN